MAKKEDILGNETPSPQELELNAAEKNQLAAMVELVSQAQQAQNIIYSNLVQSIGARYEVSNSDISINMPEVYRNGIEVARLIVKKSS